MKTRLLIGLCLLLTACSDDSYITPHGIYHYKGHTYIKSVVWHHDPNCPKCREEK